MKVTIKQRLTLGLIMFLLPVWAYAQMVNIKGTVKDNKGETLMGVSILEVGSTSNGTITDLDGKFSITIPKTASLLFSYIGYEKQTIKPEGKTVLNIILQEESKALNEVVVVGYGQMKRSDLTGSVVSVSDAAIKKSVSTSIDQVLQGRAAGVQIQANSGTPGASFPLNND